MAVRSVEATSHVVDSIRFSFYTAEEARKLSVKAITKPDLIDENGDPVPDGLCDPALGPLKYTVSCKTCCHLFFQCPGHFGHIDLAKLLYNPLLFRNLNSLLQITCFNCLKFQMKKEEVQLFAMRLELIIKGDIVAARNLYDESMTSSFDVVRKLYDESMRESFRKSAQDFTSAQHTEARQVLHTFMHIVPEKCEHCRVKCPKITCPTFGWFKIQDDDLLPSEVEDILETLWKNESRLFDILCDLQCKSSNVAGKVKGYEMFFLKVILVPPSKFRPPVEFNTQVLEGSKNVLLSKVLESNISLWNLSAGGHDIVSQWRHLQTRVNILFGNSEGIGKSDKEGFGICQLLDSQEGILRKNMMGKNVDFVCQAVVSPDPYLAVNEIGIPPNFALRLTYPERVTPWNVDKLRLAIDNGPDLHPGATYYKEKNIMHKLLSDRNSRNAISRKLSTSRVLTQPGHGREFFEGKVVYRHLRDGDIVLVNRQPALHKSGIMAHVVRILKGEKTLRMNYVNCRAYNANFYGDEICVHVPQDEISRAEGISIVNANKQYILPTNGKPIRGLIQDHIVSAVLLTMKDTFLTGDEYHQLLCGSCVPSAPPSFQVVKFGEKISAFCSANEIQPLPPAIWKPKPLWTGKQVISSILHHITRGRPPFTIKKIGRIKKEYFAQNCSEQTLHIYNNELIHGLIDKAQFEELGLVHTVHELYGEETVGTLLTMCSRMFTMFLQIHGFTCGVDDLLLTTDLERKKIIEDSEERSKNVHIRFADIKGDGIDAKNLRGKIEKTIRSYGDSATTRLDRMMSNSLNSLTTEINNRLFPNGMLKPFRKNGMSIMTASGAKGGQVNLTRMSALLGQEELEGKRVPRMVSGKTLPSFIPWEISSRAGGFIIDCFLTGLRPQEYYFHCMADCDGLVDTAIKTSHSLQQCLIKNLECLKVCYDHTVRDADGSVIQFIYGDDGLDVHKSSFIADFKVLAANRKVVLERYGGQIEDARLSKSNGFIKKLPGMLREKVTTFKNKEKKEATTHLSKKRRGSIKQKGLMRLMELKYLSSLAEPGESVGVLAAQSIGESSTQMTLNTFHFAGQGERNVTLGIPRLEEILMNAEENIRTPIMKCPLLNGRNLAEAEHVAAKLRRLCVADIIESMQVGISEDDEGSTIYKLEMDLAPFDYRGHPLTLESLKKILEGTFISAMKNAITEHLKTLSKISVKIVSHKEGSGGDYDFDQVEADEDKAGKKAQKFGAEMNSTTNSGEEIKRVIYKKAEILRFEAHFIFCRDEPRILLAEIALKTARRVYFNEYKNIEQCSVAKFKKKGKKGIDLQTEGVNFDAFWGLVDDLNINELESNDIHAMLKTYGVEAARATIINELNNAFTLCGIHIDLRHLSLIADFLTFHGGYRPMNRFGMEQFCTSPFTKMTFQTPTKFFTEAAYHGELDTMESPSARVCLGLPAKLGTGYFDLLMRFMV